MTFEFKLENPYANKFNPKKIITKKWRGTHSHKGWRERLAMLCATSYRLSLLQLLATLLKQTKKLKSCTYVLYFQKYNSSNFFNNNVSWQKKCICLSTTQYVNISPSKAGQKSKFIIQGIIYSYLSRSPVVPISLIRYSYCTFLLEEKYISQ